MKIRSNGIEYFYDGPLQGGIHLETDVHPGFMTDWPAAFCHSSDTGYRNFGCS